MHPIAIPRSCCNWRNSSKVLDFPPAFRVQMSAHPPTIREASALMPARSSEQVHATGHLVRVVLQPTQSRGKLHMLEPIERAFHRRTMAAAFVLDDRLSYRLDDLQTGSEQGWVAAGPASPCDQARRCLRCGWNSGPAAPSTLFRLTSVPQPKIVSASPHTRAMMRRQSGANHILQQRGRPTAVFASHGP
nr:hypothetical protein Hi04_10k_c4997_00022 [uncultured bacterium]